jgi:hypothetical protein
MTIWPRRAAEERKGRVPLRYPLQLRFRVGQSTMSDFRLFETWRTENFSSSLLAFAMRQSPEFLESVLKLMREKCGRPQAERITVHDIEREYQIDIPDSTARRRRRPDIYLQAEIDGKPLICLIEAKIESKELEDQLVDDRLWLDGQASREIDTILASVTKYRYALSAKPDVELRWSDFAPLVERIISQTKPKSFEHGFWIQFSEHLESIMPTFNGFTSGFSDVHRLMQEVDAFVLEVLDRIGSEKNFKNWEVYQFGYWLPVELAFVGFYWWDKGVFDRPSDRNNVFCVRKDDPERLTVIGTLREITAQCALAQQQGALDVVIRRIAERVRHALDAP